MQCIEWPAALKWAISAMPEIKIVETARVYVDYN